jgi:hypothetical protein
METVWWRLLVVRTRALLSLFVNSEEYMQSGVVHGES